MAKSSISVVAVGMASALSFGLPAYAQSASDPPQGQAVVACTNGVARWRFPFDAADTTKRVPADSAHGPAAAANTWTEIWSCVVGGHELLVKSQTSPPDASPCSATQVTTVSAWIDKRKFVDKADTNEAPACLAPGPVWAVSTIGVNANGRAWICRSRTRGAQLADHIDARCVSLSARKAGRLRIDPDYVPSGVRTPFELQLRVSTLDICERLTGRLSPLPDQSGDDPSLVEYSLPGTDQWSRGWIVGEPLEARFDADNDGTDEVVSLSSEFKAHGYNTDKLSWTSSSTTIKEKMQSILRELPEEAGKPLPIPDDNFWAGYRFRPVKIGRRTYFYQFQRLVFGWPIEGDRVRAAQKTGGSAITRGLVEAHPDGSTSLVCAWGPRLRPEEFL